MAIVTGKDLPQVSDTTIDAETKVRELLRTWFDDEVPLERAEYLAENIAIDVLTVLGIE